MATKKKRARRRAKAARNRSNHTWLTMYDCNSLPGIRELFTEWQADWIEIGDPDITGVHSEKYPVCLDVEDRNGVRLNVLLGRCRSLEDMFFEAFVCYEGKKPERRGFLLYELVDDYKIIGKNEWYDECLSMYELEHDCGWCIPRDWEACEDEDDLMDDPEMRAYEQGA